MNEGIICFSLIGGGKLYLYFMGSLCCCLNAGRSEEFSLSRQCLCFGFLFEHLFSAYSSLFQPERQTITLPHPASSGPSGGTDEDSIGSVFRPPPRPLPYDDPRCSPLYRGRSAGVFGKAPGPCDEETEPLRCGISGPQGDLTVEVVADEDSSPRLSEMPLKQWQRDVPYAFDSFEDEDVCPTCLDEYSSEDPKIILLCCHHFHLGCIYEWKERSDACPICGKMMVFDERY